MKFIGKRLWIVAMFVVSFIQISPAQYFVARVDTVASKMYPPKITGNDTSFNNYMKKLNDAIDAKNTKALLSLMDTNIKCSFGDDWGRSGFVNMWQPDSFNTQVWILLKKMIEIGGTCDSSQTSWVFPYVFALIDSYDPFTSLAITGTDVKLYSEPNSKSKTITMLTYDVVQDDTVTELVPHLRIISAIGDNEWYHIKTVDNKYSGYVYWENIWRPVDYRFFLYKENGKWSMNAFVGGD